MSHNDRRPLASPMVDDTAAAACASYAHEPWQAETPAEIAGVDEVVLVASGKGGVGKSTVTVNLASALQGMGKRVGVLDADLYGPSVARMLGTSAGLDTDEQGRVVPAESSGIYSVSVANVLPPEAALAWKGPLVAQGLMQMFHEVAWPNLDILLVDLPPGTGDVQLTILEQVPVTGAILVTTPQRLALVDAERGIALFHEMDIPVLGVVENMESYICPCCGEEQLLFPGIGVAELARHKYVALLGGIPLDPRAHELADAGTPLVVGNPNSAASRAFLALAEKVAQTVERERRAREREADEAARTAHQAFWERLLDD
jgi:ATP-binding protein involved in chromosome partitioning